MEGKTKLYLLLIQGDANGQTFFFENIMEVYESKELLDKAIARHRLLFNEVYGEDGGPSMEVQERCLNCIYQHPAPIDFSIVEKEFNDLIKTYNQKRQEKKDRRKNKQP